MLRDSKMLIGISVFMLDNLLICKILNRKQKRIQMHVAWQIDIAISRDETDSIVLITIFKM